MRKQKKPRPRFALDARQNVGRGLPIGRPVAHRRARGHQPLRPNFGLPTHAGTRGHAREPLARQIRTPHCLHPAQQAQTFSPIHPATRRPGPRTRSPQSPHTEIAHRNREARRTKKGGDPFTLPTTRELEEIFRLAPQNDDPTVSYIQLLRGNLGLKGPRISKTTVRQNFYKLRDRAGVSREIRPHDLRRTFAEETLTKTNDIRLVQQILGHSSLSTTAKYLENRNLSKIRDYLETIPMPTQVKQ